MKSTARLLLLLAALTGFSVNAQADWKWDEEPNLSDDLIIIILPPDPVPLPDEEPRQHVDPVYFPPDPAPTIYCYMDCGGNGWGGELF